MGNNTNKRIQDRKMRKIAYGPKILILGLEAAGKSTLLWMLNREIFHCEIKWIIPTIGFTVEYVKYNGMQMTSFDLGYSLSNSHSLYPLYNHFMKNAQALIWVVDSSDEDRLSGDDYSSCAELHYILNRFRNDFDGIPILILANKQDSDGALSVEEVQKRLNMVHKVVHTSDMFMSIRANTFLDMLPMNIYHIICQYSEHVVCTLPAPKIVPDDLNQTEMITSFKKGESYEVKRVKRKIRRIICKYLPPYDSWQNRQSECNIFGCSNHGYHTDGAMQGFEWLIQTLSKNKSKQDCVLL